MTVSSSNSSMIPNSQQTYRSVTLFCKSLWCDRIRLVLASIAVMLLVLVVFVGVSLNYCILQLPPIVNFILLFAALTLLAYVEALHYAVIAVEKWDMQKYKELYPRAVKCHALCDTPVKVKKFIVGRQFFVIFVVFLIAQITSFPHIPPNFAGMPSGLVLVLIQTGLPGVALVLTFGQLISQLFVEEYTIQFLNLYGCEFCIRLSLGAEYIGICNFSWLLYYISSRIFCRREVELQATMTNNSTDNILDHPAQAVEPMSPTELNRGPDFDNGNPKDEYNWFDYLKFLWSTVATIGSVVIICIGISNEAYVLPTPPAGGFIIAFLMLINLFYLEGLMIAIVGTQYWDPETWRIHYPGAYKIHKLVNQPENVKRFIIGRQFCTVLTNFLLAQIFTFEHYENPGWNPALFYVVIKSGLVGVLTILAFAQLMPELLAAEFPLRFMNSFLSYPVTYISLVFDSIGVGHCAWSIYYLSQLAFPNRLKMGTHVPVPADGTGHKKNGDHGSGSIEEGQETTVAVKPTVLRIESAEILAALELSEKKSARKAANVEAVRKLSSKVASPSKRGSISELESGKDESKSATL